VSECDHLDSKVIDSRPAESDQDNQAVWRRRECLECKQRYNTWEIPEAEYRDYLDAKRTLASILDGLTAILTQAGHLEESDQES
jgi:transcriptional regulator NrdR family protein